MLNRASPAEEDLTTVMPRSPGGGDEIAARVVPFTAAWITAVTAPACERRDTSAERASGPEGIAVERGS